MGFCGLGTHIETSQFILWWMVVVESGGWFPYGLQDCKGTLGFGGILAQIGLMYFLDSFIYIL